MTIKEYIKFQLNVKKVELKVIYEELMQMGHKSQVIYEIVNEIVKENIQNAIDDYKKNIEGE